MVRASILAFLPRLNKECQFIPNSHLCLNIYILLAWYIRSIWICGFVIATSTLVSFFYVLTECNPIL